MARPSEYTPEVAAEICAWVASGKSLVKWCAIEGHASLPTVRAWQAKYPEFLSQYAHARLACYEVWAAEIVDISDDGLNDTYIDEKGNQRTDHDVVNRSRLRVDARKWLLSKLLPKVYGESAEGEQQKTKPTKLVLHKGETRKSKRPGKVKASKE